MCKVDKTSFKPMAPIVPLSKKPAFIQPSERQTDFHWTPTDEPHATRRKLILAKYPEIKTLFGPCWKTKYILGAIVALQTYIALQAHTMSWSLYICIMYLLGGTANHALTMGIHEAAHNLGFRKPLYNKLLGLVANLPLCVPSSISFKRYHLDHHRYQGEDGLDVDLPTELEAQFFTTKTRKLVFVLFQLFFYGLRPFLVNPKVPGGWEYLNSFVCGCYNVLIYCYGGLAGVGYLLLSTIFGCGLHPVAGHFIAEHYEFLLGYETYSYYGILNLVTFNVGFHNEHHDFPFIPGSRLHQVRAMAPEFYDQLPYHTSWIKVMFDYVMNDKITAYSRVKRHNLTDEVKEKITGRIKTH